MVGGAAGAGAPWSLFAGSDYVWTTPAGSVVARVHRRRKKETITCNATRSSGSCRSKREEALHRPVDVIRYTDRMNAFLKRRIDDEAVDV
ncbi:MAG: hypothetical protein COS73_05570 [Nitrospirae bacterium CG06_land_8_20_14_3_00_70_43]|nr:MAG: hypothetical protein COS73_05570 [Nitrospirae bacterium CG06_land_8_20_14_3_00_70_43]